jgi:hypothetical protein
MKLALVGVLLGTTWLVGCAESKPAQSPSDQVSTTEITSADAPLPPPARKPLLGWFETDPKAPAKPKPLDAADPWSGQPASRAAQAPAEDPAKPAEKAATPAVVAPGDRY